MSTKISADDLAKEIEKTLQDWEKVTNEAAVKGLAVTAEKAVEKLQNAHPDGAEKWGSWDKYNASWGVKQDTSKNTSTMIIHNKKHYQLTHLLENGHALRNGGTSGKFPHIGPVAEEAEDELLDNIKKFIKEK